MFKTRAVLIKALRQPLVPQAGTRSVSNVKNNADCMKTKVLEPITPQKVLCHLRSYAAFLDPWYYVHKLGIKKCKIVRFRRKLKKYHYPWLTYSIPTGAMMALGDAMAQLYWEKKNDLNICRSLTMGGLGMFIIVSILHVSVFVIIFKGPISCKWTLFWYRRLPKFNAAEYLAKTLLLDILILQPFVTLLIMTSYDYKVVKEQWRCYDKLWKERYKGPFLDIMTFYAETRPIAAIILCFLLPSALRKVTRRMYFILFYSYLSYIMHKANIGGPAHRRKHTQANHGFCPCLKKFFQNLFGK